MMGAPSDRITLVKNSHSTKGPKRKIAHMNLDGLRFKIQIECSPPRSRNMKKRLRMVHGTGRSRWIKRDRIGYIVGYVDGEIEGYQWISKKDILMYPKHIYIYQNM
jgi:hypothetical protein